MSDLIHGPNIDLIDELGKSIIKEITSSLYKSLLSFKAKAPAQEKDLASEDAEKKINKLITNIFKWSNETQFFGLSIPLYTENNTIGLDISFNIREFTDKPRSINTISEEEIFSLKSNVFIYGDPGSGKTTTLKRLLVKQFFSKTVNQNYKYPYLLRLKDIQQGKSLFTYIADEFGFRYEEKTITYREKVKKSRLKQGGDVEYYDEIKETQRREYFIGNEKIESFISKFFEENYFLVILDGLDEINSKIGKTVQKEIEQLGLNLHNGKIIITCRPGYSNKRFESFILTQICELDQSQIERICKCWIEKPVEFLNELSTKSYGELSNRPLFLSYLLVLYKDSYVLPESAKEVYEEIIDFFLVKWDKERGITRKSKYSNFRTSVKKDFLSHLSFHLTYKIRAKVFKKQDLIEAYNLICEKFSLPKGEATEVASEVESHTGIIVKAFFNKYEFSHLSIQEFFCASYIVKEPFSYLIKQYLKVFPSPLALVIAYSSNPASWFSNIIFSCIREQDSLAEKTQTVTVLLNRIIVEQPYFDKSFDFGLSLLFIGFVCNTEDAEFLNVFLRFLHFQKNVIPSLIFALTDFKFFAKYQSTNKVVFHRSFELVSPSTHPVDHIKKVALPFETYDELKSKNLI